MGSVESSRYSYRIKMAKKEVNSKSVLCQFGPTITFGHDTGVLI
jgi:hypothetical protein